MADFYAHQNFLSQNEGHLGPNLAQNRVFGKYLDLDSYNLSDIAYSDWFQWYLTTNGGFLCLAKKFGSQLGPFWPKFGRKFCFCLISRLRLMRFVWYNLLYLIDGCTILIFLLQFRWVQSDISLLDPPSFEVGPIDWPSFVRPFVSYQFFSETDHRISLIFCIKLAYYESKKVTKPDFRKKNYLAQIWAKWAQICPNLGFSAIFLSLNH